MLLDRFLPLAPLCFVLMLFGKKRYHRLPPKGHRLRTVATRRARAWLPQCDLARHIPSMRGPSLTATVVALAPVLITAFAAAAEPKVAAAAAAATAAPARVPLAEQLSPWLALVVGSVGSAAYLIALWVGLVGSSGGKERILVHFRELWGLKVPLFIAGGGAVAMVFQLPEGKLIPVQAFIIGCTWPAVVSNYLSGKQSGEGEAQALAAAQKQADTDQLVKAVGTVPAPKAPPKSAKDEFARLIEVLEKPPAHDAHQPEPAPGEPTKEPTAAPEGSGGGKKGSA